MRECIVHFKLIRGASSKMLRALIMLPKDKQPEISDFISAFAQLGYQVVLENERELIFAPSAAGETYKLDITSIEVKGETEEATEHDGELRAILEHLVRRGW
ncbi:hypothetical protein M6D81_14015 [Paenibacillus sp. J5C_2022]|uniref:hypothetical protein n=1 Tax=Paenibacillus sp. J5C2022 TaxID=2977129 RepID=UPI0021CED525|nr:hypothetical protein [Paenibacillus sp. J5C2022]MCU6709806.1 hypothetical protein [Paenibacillus sp. J5C2022]